MDDEGRKTDESVIRDVVSAEEEAALSRFRTGRFGERLEGRLRSERAPTSHPFILGSIRRLAWVSAAALLLVAATLISVRLLRKPAPDGSLVVLSFLRQLPGIQSIENRPRTPWDASPALSTPLGRVVSGLFPGQTGSSGAPRLSEQGKGLLCINSGAEPMGLQELYDILVTDKSVERVLMIVFQKT
jgi:hypothetical protein